MPPLCLKRSQCLIGKNASRVKSYFSPLAPLVVEPFYTQRYSLSYVFKFDLPFVNALQIAKAFAGFWPTQRDLHRGHSIWYATLLLNLLGTWTFIFLYNIYWVQCQLFSCILIHSAQFNAYSSIYSIVGIAYVSSLLIRRYSRWAMISSPASLCMEFQGERGGGAFCLLVGQRLQRAPIFGKGAALIHYHIRI